VDADPWAELAEHWDEDAVGYADAAFGHLQQVLADAGPTLDGAIVCDFGAGTGLLVERLVGRAARIDAVDPSPAMLDRTRAKIEANGWTTVSASAELPSAGEVYDLVVCSSVLGFVDDLDAVVADLAGRLSSGGALVQWDWERAPGDGHGLTRDEIRSALTSAGLTDVRVGGAFTITIEGEPVTPLYGAGWRR
jgi:2-polyprenyl-3-methyl-5-hydroxy-6-metoxy-1,4-benzoquinol methylase